MLSMSSCVYLNSFIPYATIYLSFYWRAHMNNLINPQLVQLGREICEEHNQTLKEMFRSKIDGWFLIKIKDKVISNLGVGLFQFYHWGFNTSASLVGLEESPEYDICKLIVGIHCHYSVFLSEEEIKKNQRTYEYQMKIVNEVIEKIHLRQFGSACFRRKHLFLGDDFLYFPIPYELFVLCGRFYDTVQTLKLPIPIYYVDIVNNAISALTLMENNLLANAYPPCRGMIELYLKMLVLQKHPECLNIYNDFCSYEIDQSCCSQKYPEEFNQLYKKRLLQSANNKIDYLHYGWLDYISAYTTRNSNRYSLNGIIMYLQNTSDIDTVNQLEHIKTLYKMCHGYTHGSTFHVKYPLLHYFEISIMLYYVLKDVFTYVHKKYDIEMLLKDQNLLQNLDRDFQVLYEQYERRSTENFELYYGK